MDDRKLLRRDEYIWRSIDDEVVILNEEGTQVCLLNKTAAQVWIWADGKTTLDEVVGKICERFEAEPEEVIVDVQEFADQLVTANLAQWHSEGVV
jgi:hypothetical protein